MNFFYLLYLLFIGPKLFLDRFIKKKKHPAFLQRIALKIPKPTQPLIWIHAVSVGEIKALEPLFFEIRKDKKVDILITTTTFTGQMEAMRILKGVNFFAYLPLDLSFVVKRWVKKLNPKTFILVESDFWPQLLKELKKNKTQIVLVNGKMSERSFKRFSFFSIFAKRLFSYFDAVCLQSKEHLERFTPFLQNDTKVLVAGNLKFDVQAKNIIPVLNFIFPTDAICVACTHKNEEELILSKIKKHFIFLAPRHPERCKEVEHLLVKEKIIYTRLSTFQNLENLQVVLIDTIGQLPFFYQKSKLAILGGSFIDSIGGHNLLEPLLYECPVLFGPFMYGQKEITKKVKEHKAGIEVEIDNLDKVLDSILADSKAQSILKENAKAIFRENQGASLKTLQFFTDCNSH